MASCTRTDRKVEIVTIEKEIQAETYNVSLSRKEVEALLVLFRSVGGNPETTPRGDTDKINSALWNALSLGRKGEYFDICKGFHTTGSIYFKENSK